MDLLICNYIHLKNFNLLTYMLFRDDAPHRFSQYLLIRLYQQD